jgi:hypothetical protein
MSVNAILAMDNNMGIVPNVPFNKNLATRMDASSQWRWNRGISGHGI